MSKQEDFPRPEKPLEKTREIDNEVRISKKAKMKWKFNRNQKWINLWDNQLSSLILLVLPNRMYIPLNLLHSSPMFVLKFPLFIIIVPRYEYSLQFSRDPFLRLKRGMSWILYFFNNNGFCLRIIDSKFSFLTVWL